MFVNGQNRTLRALPGSDAFSLSETGIAWRATFTDKHLSIYLLRVRVRHPRRLHFAGSTSWPYNSRPGDPHPTRYSAQTLVRFANTIISTQTTSIVALWPRATLARGLVHLPPRGGCPPRTSVWPSTALELSIGRQRDNEKAATPQTGYWGG